MAAPMGVPPAGGRFVRVAMPIIDAGHDALAVEGTPHEPGLAPLFIPCRFPGPPFFNCPGDRARCGPLGAAPDGDLVVVELQLG